MGLLDSAPGGVEDTSTEDATAEEESTEAVEAAPEPVRKERVELPKAPSRRERARQENDAVLTKVTELEKALTAKEQSWQQELARRDQEIARLRGMTETLQPMVAERHKPQGPTPEDLEAQAEKALDGDNYLEHRRLLREADKLRLEQWKTEFVREQQKSQPQAQGLPVPVQLALAQHPAVRAAGERGLALANAKAMELQALYGPQPDTLERAFQAAEAILGGQQAKQPQTYSREAAGALAGVPAQRNGNGGGSSRGPGVELTPLEMDVARKSGMSYAEYAKYIAEAQPERVRQ